ncbi:hypothetical protein EXN66_Car018051 [Channa argus]|uniref:Uncharacterized protein n=1 Tax=Channa argus TaxID=215402 RepID=A0A6G1QJ77_CHAAH|nr:hypothetical protein EXN66_Car018051 [Channa argus]
MRRTYKFHTGRPQPAGIQTEDHLAVKQQHQPLFHRAAHFCRCPWLWRCVFSSVQLVVLPTCPLTPTGQGRWLPTLSLSSAGGFFH